MSLNTILPDHGYYCIFSRSGKGRTRNHFYGSRKQMVLGARALLKSNYEVWVAIATYATKSGGRKQSNAMKIRSMVLDIDGFDEGFLTKPEALAALKALSKDLGLGKPTIIDSGAGWHIWWPLTEDVPAAAWKDGQLSFKAYITAHHPKLAKDTSRTADSAGVLRLPGTPNKKRGKTVRVLQEHGTPSDYELVSCKLRKLHPQGDTCFLHLGSAPAWTLPGTGPNLYGGMDKLFDDSPADTKALITHCAQIQDAVRTGGNGHLEPQWAALLGVAAFSDAPAKLAVRMSQGDPRYTEAATLRKLDHAKGMTGPTRCETLHSHSAELCVRCPHWGKITTPVQLGRDTAPATPKAEPAKSKPAPIVAAAPGSAETAAWVPTGSQGNYKPSATGQLVSMKQPQGKLWQWCTLGIAAMSKCAIDKETGKVHGVYFRSHNSETGRFGPERLVLRSKSHQMKAAFAEADIIAKSDEEKAVFKYATDVFSTALDMPNQIVLHTNDGWTKGKSFVLNGRERHQNGEVSHCEYLDPDRQRIEPKGTISEWSQYVHNLALPSNAMYMAVMGCGYAAPLYHLIGLRGFSLAMTSPQSGVGKSVTIEACNSIYYPKADSPLLLATTTPVNLIRAMVTARSLPVMVEELDSIDKIGSILKTITGGAEKNRVSNTGGYSNVAGGRWECPFIFVRNGSVQAEISRATGDLSPVYARILEVDCEILQSTTRRIELGAVDLLEGTAYGLAGEEYISYVVTHQARCTKLVKHFIRQLSTVFTNHRNDRFLTQHTACLLAGLHIAGELGHFQADLSAVLAAIKNQHDIHVAEQTIEVNERTNPLIILLNIVSDLQSFIIEADMQGRTITLDRPREIRGRVEPSPSSDGTIYTIKGTELRKRLPVTTKLVGFLEDLRSSGIEVDYKDVRCASTARFRAYEFVIPNSKLPQELTALPLATTASVPAPVQVH